MMGWAFTSRDFIPMENYYNEVKAQHCWILFDRWMDNVIFFSKNIVLTNTAQDWYIKISELRLL